MRQRISFRLDLTVFFGSTQSNLTVYFEQRTDTQSSQNGIIVLTIIYNLVY